MPIKWLRIGWGDSKIQELKSDIIFFLLMRALLTKKIQVEKEKFKSDVYGLN